MQAEASSKERGVAALRQGDAQSAAKLLTEAVRAKPDDAEAWSALGVALCQQQRVAEGQQALARAVSLAPTRAPLHFNLAKGLELGGRQSEALASYRSALQHDPGHAGAREAVQRLTSGAAAVTTSQPSTPGASTLADFVLAPSPQPSPTASAPSHAASNPIAPPPSVRYGNPPGPTGPLMPMGAAYQVPSAPPAPVQVPRRGTPWGLILGILAILAVVGVGMAVVLTAVMLPAIQGARKAAQQARARAEMRGQYSMPPGAAGSFTPSPPADFGQPAITPGSELDRVGGGGEVRDQLFGFSAAFPAGFGAPMPEQNNRSVGLGGTASTQTYRATTGSGVAYILCYAFSPEVYDQVENQLFNLGQSGLRKSAAGRFRSSSTRYQGYAAQEVSYGGASGGLAGRARLILARPRLFLIAFESRNQQLLSKPGVTAFLDSLRIEANVAPPSVQSPMQAPGRTQMPGSSRPGSFGPRFGPGGPPDVGGGPPNIPDSPSGFPRTRFPTSPGGSRPDFTPPDIPRPPTPNFPEMRRSPPFGPGGPRFGPDGSGSGSSAPPGFGRPRFGPGGSPENGGSPEMQSPASP